ncbi:glycosyltransferase family 2 protein [Hahella sp. SMD15-11]|uniref:Glycosyltransferase family 2 protein n=1 Tax=Thermohahella caldifontis TaxID=3142973 RepID=A0AB39UYC1_9GAMM
MRNTGIHQSQGVVIYNVDADCLVNKGSIKEIRDSLKDPNVGAVGGVYLKTNEPTWVENGYILVSDEGGFGEANDLPGGSLAFRREVYEKVGGFDEDVDAGEDSRFVRVIRRLGYRVLYLPSCSVVHLNNSKTIGQLVKRQMWHGSSYFRTTPLVLDKTFFATVLFILSIISGFLSLILGCHLIFLMSLAGLFFLIFVFSLKRAKYSLSLLLSNLFPALAVSFFYFLGRALGLIYGLIQFLFKFGESKSIRKL